MDIESFAASKGFTQYYTNKKILEKLVSGSVDKGTWNAATNTPNLVQGVGTGGWYYHVTVAGTWDSTTFSVGDTILFDSSKQKWVRIATGGAQSAGSTSELAVSAQLLESLSGEATHQSGVNIENVVAIKALEEELGHKLSQYRVMPEPRSDYKNLYVLYTGTTTENYKEATIYKCSEVSTNIYKWEEVYLSVNCDNETIEENSSGQIRVKNGGIAQVKLSDSLKTDLFKATQNSENGIITLSSLI